jgi:hypothetical protein
MCVCVLEAGVCVLSPTLPHTHTGPTLSPCAVNTLPAQANTYYVLVVLIIWVLFDLPHNGTLIHDVRVLLFSFLNWKSATRRSLLVCCEHYTTTLTHIPRHSPLFYSILPCPFLALYLIPSSFLSHHLGVVTDRWEVVPYVKSMCVCPLLF